jgi:L-ribulose-5-phosphate 3-epimerase
VRGIAVKDFLWVRDAKGLWRPEWKPLGEGMVRFAEFFAMVAASGFSGPVQLHLEYPLSRDEAFTAMRRDLTKLRGYLEQAKS